MVNRLCRCNIRQMLIAALVAAMLIYLPAMMMMQRLISSRDRGRSKNVDSSDWRWKGGQNAYEDNLLDPGGSKEESKRYRAEVNDLKRIAQSLREEIGSMYKQNAEHKRDAGGAGVKAKSPRDKKPSLKEASAIAENIPKESDPEYDLRCPHPVDDILMPASPIRMNEIAPDTPKLMPRPDTLVEYPLPKAHYKQPRSCSVATCMDIARCSLTRPFRVYLYGTTLPEHSTVGMDAAFATVKKGIEESGYLTSDPAEACLFAVVVRANGLAADSVWSFLKALDHWKGDGRNHAIIDVASLQDAATIGMNDNFEHGNSIMAAMFAGHPYGNDGFNTFFPSTGLGEHANRVSGTQDATAPRYKLLPTYRHHLISYSGSQWQGSIANSDTAKLLKGHFVTKQDLAEVEKRAGPEFSFRLECDGEGVGDAKGRLPGWYLCGKRIDLRSAMAQSTFTLVIEPLAQSGVQLAEFVQQIADCIELGSIPVILRTYTYTLPFGEVLDWSKAALVIPAARVTEMNYILANILEDAILSFRQQGRFLWETYFSSAATLVKTLVNVIRHRLGLPAAPLHGVSLPNHVSVAPPPSYKPLPSPVFQQNITYGTLQRWNNPPGGLFLPPMSPFVEHKPSGWEYIRRKGDERKMHPVIKAGGALWGETFQNYLSGTHEPERFTVVMLTYRRQLVLFDAVKRLADMPRLDRVIVIWNDNEPPAAGMSWPEIGVPLEVVRVERNSLNNRFLPLDSIKTEAVLSLDDDTQLRHEEMDFAFRAWRENRHRLVGFPGRFHSWDSRHGGWAYNANYSCELSMVLTGAAFIHKFYLHMYSQLMDGRIREHVDKVMNCEDIAMNMLVSHFTRMPPVKATLRWTFHCAGCADALSDNTGHFNERHECMNVFADIYGYMPLIKSQTRFDSMLFKTRVPRDRGKCYTYV